MKKQIQSIRFFLFASLLIAGLTATANNNVITSENLNAVSISQDFDTPFYYSWTAEPGAVSYTVDMVNRATQESYNWETSNTSITVLSLPSGSYDLTVTAVYASQFSSIIIEDMVEH